MDPSRGTPYTGIDGVEAWEINPLAGPLSVRISRERPPAPTQAVLTEWDRMRAANPRYHDSPVLSVLSFDPERNEAVVRRDGYMRLAVQPRVPTGVRQLSVTAILSAHEGGRGGREYVLLGRRSDQTRIYGGLWELGPSGGVHVPPANIETIDLEYLTRWLADEISEEVGVQVDSAGTPVAYVRDLVASSDDVTLRFSLGTLEQAAARVANWEYTEIVWMPVDCAVQWDNVGTIATTRATFRVMGWVGGQ